MKCFFFLSEWWCEQLENERNHLWGEAPPTLRLLVGRRISSTRGDQGAIRQQLHHSCKCCAGCDWLVSAGLKVTFFCRAQSSWITWLSVCVTTWRSGSATTRDGRTWWWVSPDRTALRTRCISLRSVCSRPGFPVWRQRSRGRRTQDHGFHQETERYAPRLLHRPAQPWHQKHRITIIFNQCYKVIYIKTSKHHKWHETQKLYQPP